MADVVLKKMDLSSPELPEVQRIYEELFPPSERFFTIKEMIEISDKISIEVNTIKDGDLLVGFCVIWSEKKWSYLLFIGINSKLQGGGYGSKAMNAIRDNYNDVPLVFGVEEIDPNAPNAVQRERRKNFYLKLGFYDTGFRRKIESGGFEIMASVEKLDASIVSDMTQTLKKVAPDFVIE